MFFSNFYNEEYDVGGDNNDEFDSQCPAAAIAYRQYVVKSVDGVETCSNLLRIMANAVRKR